MIIIKSDPHLLSFIYFFPRGIMKQPDSRDFHFITHTFPFSNEIFSLCSHEAEKIGGGDGAPPPFILFFSLAFYY